MGAPIQLYVEHEEYDGDPYDPAAAEFPGNRVAKLCVGPFTVLKVRYWSYEAYEDDEKAAEAIADELHKLLEVKGNVL